jgi:hypothetical protein
MNVIRKLSNPFILGAQGFVIGAILFTVAPAREPIEQPTSAPVSAYQLPEA